MLLWLTRLMLMENRYPISDMVQRNRFGRLKYDSKKQSEAALNAGLARQLSIADATVDSYGPFCFLRIENFNSSVTLRVAIDGAALGDASIVGAKREYNIPPLTGVEITPYSNGDPDVVFQRVVIKNTSGVDNLGAGDIIWQLRNW